LTSTPTAFDQLSAALADRYLIARELGRGGIATVYLAHDLRHDRPVAIKALRPELAAALGRERSLLLGLSDSGEVDGLLCYAMPYVEGESVRARLQRERDNIPVAQEYYQRFLSRYDLPSPNQRHLVKEAREALPRLSGQRAPPAERAP
jgi:serine/threonine protein kinase